MADLFETAIGDLPPAKPLTLGLWTTAIQAARILLEAGAGEALVLDSDRPLGVVTTRGLTRILALHGVSAPHLAVRDVMDPVAISPEIDTLPAALRHLLAAPSRRLAVVDARGQATGLVAPFHVARLCCGLKELAGRTVASAMARVVVTARPDEDLSLVLDRMVRTGVGGLAVAEADRPRGMFTARDAMAILSSGGDVRGRRVADSMRAPVVAISPQLTLSEALAGMDGDGAGRLIVTDAAGYLLGLLTWTDIVAQISQVLSDEEGSALRGQVHTYRDLYDNAPQGLFRMDTNGQLLSANETLARLLGYRDAAEFLHQARQSAHPLRLDLPERRHLLTSALAQSEPVAFEARSFAQDGSSSRVYCVMRAVYDTLGAPRFLEGSCADFPVGTPPTGLLTHDAGYRSIVEHQTELICRYRADGHLTYVNAAFARYWGLSAERCVKDNFRPTVPPEDAALIGKRLAALTPTRPTTGFEHRVIRPDGRIRWQRWIHRAIFDDSGQLLEYQAVGRDTTARKLAEERLKAQYGHVRSLIEALPLPVFVKDVSGRYTSCNQAFETTIGLPRSRVIGHLPRDFQSPEVAATIAQKDAELLAKGGWQVYESEFPRINGAQQVVVRKSLVHDADGNVSGIVGTLLDITDRKRAAQAAASVCNELETLLARKDQALQEAAQRLDAERGARQQAQNELRRRDLFIERLFDAVQVGICVLTPDMTITTTNRAMRALYPRVEELCGNKCHEVCNGLDRPCLDCPALRVLATGKAASSLVPRREFGEQTAWLELFCHPLRDADDRVAGVLVLAHDITAGRKLEAELAAALERAEAGSKAKGAFLANMSHEIRTPLNAVLGYVQLMLRDHLEPRQRERLTVVEESAATLLSIINDILDYSKIEAGRLEIKAESFDLTRCLEAVIKEQEVLARNKGLALALTIEEQVPASVRGDGLRLRQILRNLVNNAVKYTETGGVTLTASRSNSDPARPYDRLLLRFTVSDTGVGIPKAQQSTIFDSFTQVDGGLTKCQAGTGLGLAICRRLAGLMGGGIFMESTPGEGSVFWLECPFDAAPAQAVCKPRPLDAAACGTTARRLRILLVEDNRVNRVFASDLLESQGHDVLTAENGRVALDTLTHTPVDVVLMDIQMPVMDGLAATRAIRAGHMRIDPDLPVIGLSAYAMDQERKRFLAAGLDDYISKPIDVEAFFSAVNRVLSKRGRTPVLRETVDGSASDRRDILDTTGLAAQYRDKAGLLIRVGREFVASVPEQLRALETALGVDDLTVCERVAHTLKGNAAMFGATTMRALAAQIEIAAAEGDMAKVRALAPTLAEACHDVVVSMGDYITRLQQG